MKLRASSFPIIAAFVVSLGMVCGSDRTSTISMAGPPPPDAQLVVSEVDVDTSWDSTVRTVLFSFRVDWKIDSADFLLRTYRFGLAFRQTDPPWLPGPGTIPLPGPEGTFRDTLSCKADTCLWMSPMVEVLARLSKDEFLSVAQRTIQHDGSTTP